MTWRVADRAPVPNTVPCETLDAMWNVCGIHCGILFTR